MVKAHIRKTKKGKTVVKSHKRINEAQIGDGMVPNKYWVSWGNDFYICKDGSCNWASDSIKLKWKGGTKGPFKTFAEAMNVLDELAFMNMEETPKEENMNVISVEDRLSGQIYEIAVYAYPKKTIMGTGYDFTIKRHRDTKFTQENLAKRGMRFE